MLKEFKTNLKLKTFIAIFLTPILLLGFLVGTARAEWAGHLVISEIQIGGASATDEFVELYNPTGSVINLSGWRLTKKTASGTTVANLLTAFPDKNIPAFGYFLITHSTGYDGAVAADAVYSTSSSLSSDNTIILYSDAGNTVVDLAGMGAAINFEGAIAENPLVDGSVERKANINSTAESLTSGTDKYLGNGWDTNNNSADFVLRAVSDPQNSSSSIEPLVGNPPATNLIPTPTLIPTPSSSPAASLPVAEAGQDKEAVIGENIDFDGSDSFDPQGKELVLTWDFGDKTSAKGINVSHSYNEIGEYRVILKADNGENISEDSLKIKIIAPEFSD
ncbi:MAG: PKD domain-containing protein, partial [Patescibacteria group bacterium]